jgi:outer membrane biosynthesis protein TonB
VHAVIIALAWWASGFGLPWSPPSMNEIAAATGEAAPSIVLLSSPRTAPHKGKQQGRATKPRPSPPYPHVDNSLFVDNQLEFRRDSLSAMNSAVAWALPLPPRADSVNVAGVSLAELARAPRLTGYSRAPQLDNRDFIRSFLEKHFPRTLRQDGGEARTILWLLIDVQGKVFKALVRETSGRAPVDSLALAASNHMSFQPAEQAGRRVPVWVLLPVRLRVEDIYTTRQSGY